MSGIKSKVFNNASWIIVCKIFQAIIAIVVSSLSARYLGPSNYGIINYAASIAAFMLPITQLGLNATLVKEFIDHPDDEGETLGSALVISSISAVLCVLATLAFAFLFNRDEKQTIIVCALYSSMLFFQALELITYWFQSHYLSKYVSLLSLSAYVLVSAYKIYLLASRKSIEWFAVSNALDYCIISIGLIFIYRHLNRQRLKFSVNRVKAMLTHSWTYIISGLMAVVYAQTDRVMLKNMVGDVEVGLYSAAINCIGYASFVFAAIIDSFRPYVISLKKQGRNEYENSVTQLYSIVIYLALVFCSFCCLFPNIIIRILYGADYAPAGTVLRILAWYAVFNYYGAAQSVWMLAEGYQKYLTLLGSIGAFLNIILNYLLIPRFGAMGATAATLTTSVVANLGLCAIIRPLRKTLQLLFRSLSPKIIYLLIRNIGR